jgi:hypothetical protein
MLFFAEAYGHSFVRVHRIRQGFARRADAGRRLDGPCLEGRVTHIADVLADPDYTWAEAQRLGGYRTVLGVPMLREGIPSAF